MVPTVASFKTPERYQTYVIFVDNTNVAVVQCGFVFP